MSNKEKYFGGVDPYETKSLSVFYRIRYEEEIKLMRERIVEFDKELKKLLDIIFGEK